MSEPKVWETLGLQHSRYNRRDFFGEHADDMAELHYLRDWKRWADPEVRRYFWVAENVVGDAETNTFILDQPLDCGQEELATDEIIKAALDRSIDARLKRR